MLCIGNGIYFQIWALEHMMYMFVTKRSQNSQFFTFNFGHFNTSTYLVQLNITKTGIRVSKWLYEYSVGLEPMAFAFLVRWLNCSTKTPLPNRTEERYRMAAAEQRLYLLMHWGDNYIHVLYMHSCNKIYSSMFHIEVSYTA